VSRHLLTVFFGLVAAIAIGAFVGQCNDKADTVQNAVDKERVRVADSLKNDFLPIIKRLSDSVEVRIVRVGELLKRDTLWKFDTVYAVDTVTGEPLPAVPLPQHQALVVSHDSLKAACSLLVIDCKALKDSVPKLTLLLENTAKARDSVIEHPAPFRRWSISVTVGTGGCIIIPGAVPLCGVTGPSYRVW